MKKRLLALLLSAALILSLTTPVLAENDPAEGTTDTQQTETCDSCGNALHEGECPPAEPEDEGEPDNEGDGNNADGEGVNMPTGDSENNTNTTNDENVNNENGEDGQPAEGDQGNDPAGPTACETCGNEPCTCEPVCPGDDTCDIEGCQNHTPVGCAECGQTEGHAETCSQYVAPAPTVCETCGQAECTCPLTEEPVVCEVCGEIECICGICEGCGMDPCECGTQNECTCGAAEEEVHAVDCPISYEETYRALMQADSVDAFGEISSMFDEVETNYFRQWMSDNGLLEAYFDHMDEVLSGGGTVRRSRKLSLSKSGDSGTTGGEALKLFKSVAYNSTTGLYDITLESYTTGVVEEGQVMPADTVLVLDVSGSMAWDYKSTRLGVPMYGDYFHHSSGNYWGWLLNEHLVNGRNPYVMLPNGAFAEAAYYITDKNNVEIFRVVSGTYAGTLFYPKMQTENITTVPRVYNYPVYQLYSSTVENDYTVVTGVPMFGSKFENGGTWYGWIGDGHRVNGSNPYVRFEDGTFAQVYYKASDANHVEYFGYTDNDTGAEYLFYPRLIEKDNDVERQFDYPIVQLYSSYNTSRMAALHDAVAEFLRLTAEKNAGLPASAQSRVSIVQFSCDASHTTEPTKVVRGLTGITEDNVDEWIALTYALDDGGQSTHTEIGDGMVLAKGIFADSSTSRASFKAVIAFTDGKPECDDTSGGGFSFIQTDKAIAAAKDIGDLYNGAVYTICIQDYAEVNEGEGLPPREGKGVNDDRNNINRFMHLLSNNYPNAENMSTPGSGSTSGGYYMVPGADVDLTNIFTQIGEQIGNATINLGTEARVDDYVTPYFEILDGSEVEISVMDADYSGGSLDWKTSSMSKEDFDKITYSKTGSMVSVTGFDYNKNFVASTGRTEGNIALPGDFYGRKLIIKFSICPKTEFLGGNYVPTNESKSGVYTAEGIVAAFPEPHVDIPTTVKVTKQIVSGNVSVEMIDDFVFDIQYGQFTGYSENSSNVSGNYLEAIPDSEMRGSKEMRLGDGASDATTKDALVGESIKIVEKATSKYIVEYSLDGGDTWTKLTADQDGNCTYTGTVTAGMEIIFRNTLKRADLTIQKTGTNETLDSHQTFIFHVVGNDTLTGGVNMDVVVYENGKTTIKDLPVGNYTVTEEDGWSWRYTVASVTNSKNSGVSDGKITLPETGEVLTFNNSRNKTQWIDGNNYCQNIFSGDGVIVGEAILPAGHNVTVYTADSKKKGK